jgi:hypothetical protein
MEQFFSAHVFLAHFVAVLSGDRNSFPMAFLNRKSQKDSFKSIAAGALRLCVFAHI